MVSCMFVLVRPLAGDMSVEAKSYVNESEALSVGSVSS